MTTRKGNESIVQKENCFVEEIKEVELRSRRGKFIAPAGFKPLNPRRHSRSPRVYREENFVIAGKVSIFENTARKGLPKVRWG